VAAALLLLRGDIRVKIETRTEPLEQAVDRWVAIG
jgi:hypothetical protein